MQKYTYIVILLSMAAIAFFLTMHNVMPANAQSSNVTSSKTSDTSRTVTIIDAVTNQTVTITGTEEEIKSIFNNIIQKASLAITNQLMKGMENPMPSQMPIVKLTCKKAGNESTWELVF